MTRLFLLDGTALAYRSHFALARSGLTTLAGQPIGATFGFTMTLRRILETEEPDLVAVALDAKGPTFRHEKFESYKATREKAPEELIDQLELIRDVVKAHNIPLFELPGYEADDVIGTLARQGEAAGHEVFIVSGDKDFMQLVSDKVQLYNVFKRGVDLEIQGKDAVKEKFGTTPDHVIDVLALMGDASDNIPGVKGIGEKGAIKLIEEFGSVPGLLENLDSVKGKNREKIENDREMLELSLELVTIHTDVPLDPPFAELTAPDPNPDELADLFVKLDFRSLADKVRMGAPRKSDLVRDYVQVKDRADLEKIKKELRAAGTFAWDTETTGLSPLEVSLVGVSFSAAPGRAFYVPFNATPPVLPGGPPELLDFLRPLLTDPDLQRVGQNVKYDSMVLYAHGISMPPPAFDTMVASFTVAGADRRHGLDELALHYFNLRKIPTSELIGTGRKQITMAEVLVEQVSEYACEDADVTFRLYEQLKKEVEDEGFHSLYYDLELPLVPVLQAMETRGIRLDTESLAELGKELVKEMQAAEADVRRLAETPDLNLNSPKALGAVLFEKLEIQVEAGVKKPKKTKTGWATDHATLTTNYGNVEIVKRLLEFREVSKLHNTYVESLPRYVNPNTGRVHCHFSQISAATGRLASSNPNLQNIPVRTARGRKLREVFVPRPADEHGEWVLLAADYSQVELRIMAHLSGDAGLRQAFQEGQDIHASTAAKIFDLDPAEVDRERRSQAKAINFGLLYGMGAQRLARETGLTVPEAKTFIERYFEAFPGVRKWIDRTLEDAREKGFVETLFGRRRNLPELTSKNPRMAAMAENVAVNTPVQGSAADIIKRAMIDLENRLTGEGHAAQMLLQVHDELVLEVPLKHLEETIAIVRDCMENAVQLDVPLVVDFGHGKNWLEAH
ncbi:MAG: DNA polymerase I [Planctomycetes bacterium]|nr:DNA polymerase I [Planctomycetota bacterium]